LCAACGQRSPNLSNFGPYILGGIAAQPGAWPWQAFLNITYYGTTYIRQCGGTLISNRWILTSGDCAVYSGTPLAPSKFLAWLGSTSLYGGTTVTFDTVVVHPQYSGTYYVYDFALLRLSSPITLTDYIIPACLPTPDVDLTQFKACLATGFGKTNYSASTPSSTLQQVVETFPSPSTCNYGAYFNNSYDICLGTGPCAYDVGGPVVCKDSAGIWTQVGLPLFYSTNNCLLPVAGRLSAVLSWIQAVAGFSP